MLTCFKFISMFFVLVFFLNKQTVTSREWDSESDLNSSTIISSGISSGIIVEPPMVGMSQILDPLSLSPTQEKNFPNFSGKTLSDTESISRQEIGLKITGDIIANRSQGRGGALILSNTGSESLQGSVIIIPWEVVYENEDIPPYTVLMAEGKLEEAAVLQKIFASGLVSDSHGRGKMSPNLPDVQ